MFILATIITILVVNLMSWSHRYDQEQAVQEKIRWYQFTNLRYTVVGVSAFLVAWMWADFFKYNWYYVLFSQSVSSLAEPLPTGTYSSATIW